MTQVFTLEEKNSKTKYITRNLKTYVDQWNKSFVNNSLGFTFISLTKKCQKYIYI